MVIGTKLIYYADDIENYNGVGKISYIGFCKEPPKEVLRKIIKTHNIHSYMAIHCAPLSCNEYASSGICIYPLYDDLCKNTIIRGSVDNFLDNPLMISNRSSIFRINSLRDRIFVMEENGNVLPEGNPWKNIYTSITNDLKDIYNQLLQEHT